MYNRVDLKDSAVMYSGLIQSSCYSVLENTKVNVARVPPQQWGLKRCTFEMAVSVSWYDSRTLCRCLLYPRSENEKGETHD